MTYRKQVSILKISALWATLDIRESACSHNSVPPYKNVFESHTARHMSPESGCSMDGEGTVGIWTYAKMQSIERMKIVRLKRKGISAHGRLMTSETRMLKDVSAQQKL